MCQSSYSVLSCAVWIEFVFHGEPRWSKIQTDEGHHGYVIIPEREGERELEGETWVHVYVHFVADP